jgi:HAD superfamily hydrolase (TIGR01662 family)
VADTAAVFFDVDFTLIRPGPRFRASGYTETCAQYGVCVDPESFDAAVAGAAAILDAPTSRYHDELFVDYTSRIISLMGGVGPGVMTAAREIYDDWAHHHHFELYDDVPDALLALHARGLRLGLISNSHRSLTSFQTHFALDGLLSVVVSSAEFGVMKPDPRIFQEALDRMQVSPEQAVMVGDSLAHDVMGAKQSGMRGVWLDRSRNGRVEDPTITVIRTLTELADVL